jgi:hypothetical protein
MIAVLEWPAVAGWPARTAASLALSLVARYVAVQQHAGEIGT